MRCRAAAHRRELHQPLVFALELPGLEVVHVLIELVPPAVLHLLQVSDPPVQRVKLVPALRRVEQQRRLRRRALGRVRLLLLGVRTRRRCAGTLGQGVVVAAAPAIPLRRRVNLGAEEGAVLVVLVSGRPAELCAVCAQSILGGISARDVLLLKGTQPEVIRAI